MAKRWSPVVAVIVWVVIAFVALCAIGIAISVVDGSFDKDPEAAGQRVGRIGTPFLIAVGVIAYLWQKSKIRNDK